MPNYKEAFQQIRNDAELSHKFVNDPKGTLESLGVSTSNLSTTSKTSSESTSNGVCVGCGVCVG